MKTIILLFFTAFFFSCDIFESNLQTPVLLHTMKVENIQIDGNRVQTDIILSTGTPCYYFYSSEITKTDSECIIKIYGKEEGEICLAVLDSIKHVQEIIFPTSGEKKLKFYRFDGEYLDTIITIN
ncbi:MAG TPA: hypothetical protein VHP32_05630 [Ignavibacteria bacterium]|nr:hypothetical protein [Ignavibacteria bacterium]